ncbi:hypothetical protein KIW84_062514 [Lathyrus oleraceus]|uniref:Uncharacterized protein n=1 Tax=Pisum sativum TaxID=3888 RepID=A0A9D4W7H3_PEA|nr:hypothetical protein KIW84_062514 [Pisum sativum]
MSYAELYPSLVLKNLLQPRNPPQIPEPLPWWYKAELRCAFQQGAPNHDIENCYPLKYEVQKSVKSGMMSFEDRAPNVKANPLSLMVIPLLICVNRSISPLVIQLAGPVPYASNRVVPYQYNATMVENGQEVPLHTTNSIMNIADIMEVTRSGRVFGPVFPKDVEDVSECKKGDVPASEFNMVEQLLQTPSKISVLSLLMNYQAHKEALQRVLEQAYVEHDVTVDQFDHILANITYCNNLSFCDEELPEEGRN